MRKTISGFTIVELLIVIVVIAILAAISIVAYNGIQDRAKRSSMVSDLSNSSKILKLDQVKNQTYPTTITAANDGLGLKNSNGNTYRYSVNNSVSPQTFCLTVQNSDTFYMVTQDSAPSEGSCYNAAAGVSATNALLTDGNTSSNPYYGAAAGLTSVTVTMPSAIEVTSVKVWHYYADSRTYYATRTEVSADGTNWTTIFDSASQGTYVESAAGRTHTFSMRPVRYIRDWLNGSTANTSNHWVEIQAY